jgi:hypothetical protein
MTRQPHESFWGANRNKQIKGLQEVSALPYPYTARLQSCVLRFCLKHHPLGECVYFESYRHEVRSVEVRLAGYPKDGKILVGLGARDPVRNAQRLQSRIVRMGSVSTPTVPVEYHELRFDLQK